MLKREPIFVDRAERIKQGMQDKAGNNHREYWFIYISISLLYDQKREDTAKDHYGGR